MSDLAGQRALVTAAAQGIGRATAEALARAGAEVHATDINADGLADLAGCRTHRLDVRDGDAVSALCDRLGAVDILFNCAGMVHGGSILEATDEDLDAALDLNLRSMIRTIRAVLPGMRARGAGCIVNVSSVASSVKGVPQRFVYGTTKAAVIGLTKSVAADYVAEGIRCNAICPGTVESPSWHERVRAAGAAIGNVEKARADFIARQPMGRVGTPDEVAELALWLVRATFTTGQAINIDGGWTI